MLNNNINIKTNNHISDKSVTKVRTEIPAINEHVKILKTSEKELESQIKQELNNYNPDSIFDRFIKSLQNSPVLSTSVKKLLLSKQFINGNIKNDPILNTLFESFIENIKMDNSEILEFLKFQKNNYTKFQGEFFNKLRNFLISNDNEDYKLILSNFLKTYDCFVSVEETTNSINSAIKNIENNLPEMLKSTFKELTGKLIYDKNNLELNLKLLKNEIIPFLGKYISKMNDFGAIKNYTSVLIHNLTKLELASKENLSYELENLFEFLKYNYNISEKQMKFLKESLISSYEETNTVNNDSLKTFFTLLKKGAVESENPVNKGLIKEMTDSILFNHSINLPLIHLFLPLNYNDTYMFSEIWIEEESKDKDHKYEKSHKAFITFDIQNLGYFEIVLKLNDNNIMLDIYVPNSISAYTDKIKKDLSTLLDNNGITVKDITVKESIKVRRFNEIFTNLGERNSIDVKI